MILWPLGRVDEAIPGFRRFFELSGKRDAAAQWKLSQEAYRESGITGWCRIFRESIESEVKPHARYALEALEAGKHLHLEKPPSENMADMRKILDLARRKKLIVQIGYMWRHHPGMNKVIEAARQGWLGDIYLVRGQMNTLITTSTRNK